MLKMLAPLAAALLMAGTVMGAVGEEGSMCHKRVREEGIPIPGVNAQGCNADLKCCDEGNVGKCLYRCLSGELTLKHQKQRGGYHAESQKTSHTGANHQFRR